MTLFSKISGAALNQGLQFEQVLKCALEWCPKRMYFFWGQEDSSGFHESLCLLVIKIFA